MKSAYQRLCDLFERVYRLDHASTYLNWDQMVMMPDKGVEARSRALAELADIRHELLTADTLPALFADAAGDVSGTAETANLREMRRRWQRSVCLPAELVKAQIIAGAKCEHEWRSQRIDNDWPGFLANFREVLRLSRQEASLRQAADPERFAVPYDAMLDLHCSGDTSAMICALFADLKQCLPPLLDRIMQHQQGVSVKSLQGSYPIEAQAELNRQLMTALGFDFDGGRLDVSVHPFSTGVSGDLRITTRFQPNEFTDALQATAHETGHASYDGGLPAQWQVQPLGAHRNMCIHESQSLLFEKQIMLSRAFWQYFMPRVQQSLPDTRALTANEIWQACTRVSPSYIRVEADEVTYPLHVMLRYDIESALINAEAEADDIPAMWESGMQNYLGLSVGAEHSKGCLQDIHWTDGAFGYFPSYTLGAINGAQLFATIKKSCADWQQRFAEGDIGFVRQWLAEHIWSKASLLESQNLMQEATGEGSNAAHLLEHLEARYLQEAY